MIGISFGLGKEAWETLIHEHPKANLPKLMCNVSAIQNDLKQKYLRLTLDEELIIRFQIIRTKIIWKKI